MYEAPEVTERRTKGKGSNARAARCERRETRRGMDVSGEGHRRDISLAQTEKLFDGADGLCFDAPQAGRAHCQREGTAR